MRQVRIAVVLTRGMDWIYAILWSLEGTQVSASIRNLSSPIA